MQLSLTYCIFLGDKFGLPLCLHSQTLMQMPMRGIIKPISHRGRANRGLSNNETLSRVEADPHSHKQGCNS